ncbi:SANT and BTB domain regulator of class switch recombination-like [Metopolophium dirhodum]|uniref:SANT and BTB domain regulator of class switch recombination-like n=1 Tax=Metopolophium dirhodum TaxID=44670 RepID=UPI0029900C7D|nr:SANT and BTB domain regulator of class switch recombination-like [Metopolophium dirhodum]
MKDFPKKWSMDVVDTETFIDSMNRLMNNDDDDTSSSSTDDTDTNNAKPLNKNQTQLSYTNLINDLLENNPNSEYGHFESYANAMYCHDCQMMLQPKYISRIPCKVPEFVVQQDGTVIYVHSKCEKLDLTKYIQSLATQTGSWEKTYWQIWSECHFLTCITCKLQYPVRNSAMCQYHPEIPEYFPIGNLGLEQPIGRYPCCGERAFRFELVKNPFGCKFRMHIPNKENLYSGRIVKLMCKNLDLTVAHPPALNRESKIMKFVNLDPGIKRPNYQHWWVKLTLGANGYTHQPIISSGCNFLTGQKKLKKWKDLNKRREKNLIELKKWVNINNKQPIVNSSKSSINVKENADVNPPISNEKLIDTKNLINQGNLWKKSSPMTSIQDSQREQERIFFDQIIVNHVKSIKGVKGSPGTPDQLRDSYTLIRANMLAKIEAQNKSTNLKPTKSCNDKKKKF